MERSIGRGPISGQGHSDSDNSFEAESRSVWRGKSDLDIFHPCSRYVSDFLLVLQGDIDEKEIRSREAAGTLEKLTNDVLKVCILTPATLLITH